MNLNDEIAINFNKLKILLYLLVCLFFIFGGYYVFIEYMFIGKILGLILILIFGYASISFIKKLFTSTPALRINLKGIYDNSSTVKAGQISWDEIISIKILTVKPKDTKEKFLAIKVKNAIKYQQKGNVVKRLIAKINNDIYGTPIYISFRLLDTNAEALNSLLNEKLDSYKINKN